MTKTIEIRKGHFEEFEFFDLKLKEGDIIYFDNALEGYTPEYAKARVTKVLPDHWWIYDDGRKTLGAVHCTVIESMDEFEIGENFQVDFCDILLERPAEMDEDIQEEGLTFEEAIVSIISMLDTPIGRRKNSDDMNTCLHIIKNEAIRRGWIEE